LAAVLLAVATPTLYTAEATYVQYITSKKVGFEAETVTFSTTAFISIFLIIYAGSYQWVHKEFDIELLYRGVFGSFFDVIGIACMETAFSKGPAGAVSALLSVESLLMMIYDSVFMRKWPSILEFVGFFIGIEGVLIMIFPV
jgi:drug/metabolite transporter (DMT)-like permease